MPEVGILIFYHVCKNLNLVSKKYHVKKLIYKINVKKQSKKLIKTEIIKYSKKQIKVFYRTISPIKYRVIDAEYIS